MNNIYAQTIETRMQELYNRLPERNRRLYAGIEALKLHYGGVSYIARLFNCSRDTVLLGIQELNEEETLPQNRNRRNGGGRTAVLDKGSNIDVVFLLLLKEHTAGDPMDEKVKWTDLTCADISVAASHGERTRGLVVPGSDQAALFIRRAIAQRINKVGIRTIAFSHLRECCVAWAEFTRAWRSGAYAGRPGHNGCRVGESILATWMSQNLSRGSDTLVFWLKKVLKSAVTL